jgi:integral membrane sensor domain MASE1
LVNKLGESFFSARKLGLLASLCVIYFVAGRLGLKVAFVHPYVTPIWIPSGVALAAFILCGYEVWPAILLGSFLDHVTRAGLTANTFSIPLASVLEGIAGAYVVKKFAYGAKAFDSAKGVFLFVLLGCVCATVINPTVGISFDYLQGHIGVGDIGFRWLSWWLAHGIGALLVAPFLILVFRTTHHGLDAGEVRELTVLLLGLIFVCLLVFGPLSRSLNKDQIVQVWVCVPFLIWAAFRFCPLEAAGTTLILFGTAIWGTLHGYGSFVARNLTTSLILLDTFIGVIGTMTLVVAAMVVERRHIEGELLGTQSLLQDAVERKERDLVVTVRALEVEMTGHGQTKRALHESQERFQRLAENTSLDDLGEIQKGRERLE